MNTNNTPDNSTCHCSPNLDMRCNCFPDHTAFKERFKDSSWTKDLEYPDNWLACPNRVNQTCNILCNNRELAGVDICWDISKIQVACELIGLTSIESKEVIEYFEDQNEEDDSEEDESIETKQIRLWNKIKPIRRPYILKNKVVLINIGFKEEKSFDGVDWIIQYNHLDLAESGGDLVEMLADDKIWNFMKNQFID